jgi:hypothetical protein
MIVGNLMHTARLARFVRQRFVSPPFLRWSTSTSSTVEVPNECQRRWHDDIENSEWLELLRPFTSVKNLYAPHIVPALQELTII